MPSGCLHINNWKPTRHGNKLTAAAAAAAAQNKLQILIYNLKNHTAKGIT